jgi:hypothetical protein
MKWGELNLRPGWAVMLALFEDHFSFNVHLFRLNVWITLPFLQRFHREPHEIMESWGLSCEDGDLHLRWGRRYKIIHLFWRHWVQVAHDVRRADGSWVPFVGSWEQRGEHRPDGKGKEPDGRQLEQYPYRYLLRSGQVQEVVATIHVERRVRRLKVLRWTSLFQRVSYAIDVAFSNEIGEESGSWKGGTVGCGYELRPGETPRECLKRMERDRRFE